MLRLIDREVAFNQTSRLPKLAGIQDLDLHQRQVGPPLVKEAWHQARVRLAQLLENSGHYRDLADYYHDLQELNDLIGEHGSPKARGDIKSRAVNLTNKGLNLRKWIKDKYLKDFGST